MSVYCDRTHYKEIQYLSRHSAFLKVWQWLHHCGQFSYVPP
ncbi:MAG: hypothetical protein AAGE92_05815 [Cyanobacteria bacterium P01_G01_bin.4]